MSLGPTIKYRLLQLFKSKAGEILLKRDIWTHIWKNRRADEESRTLSQYIRALRREGHDITTLHGTGFIYNGLAVVSSLTEGTDLTHFQKGEHQ